MPNVYEDTISIVLSVQIVKRYANTVHISPFRVPLQFELLASLTPCLCHWDTPFFVNHSYYTLIMCFICSVLVYSVYQVFNAPHRLWFYIFEFSDVSTILQTPEYTNIYSIYTHIYPPIKTNCYLFSNLPKTLLFSIFIYYYIHSFDLSNQYQTHVK